MTLALLALVAVLAVLNLVNAFVTVWLLWSAVRDNAGRLSRRCDKSATRDAKSPSNSLRGCRRG